ncbi:hypothetical protein Sulku_2658 (plasmid) [Sulfuricurvum kujiense DSM 16994]|uniref:Uncharacterized protein n=1 Tax=Sulfuricurvum kujiense (strain ATCC BAA-921 / DSM 16994 / JCM 11577 / YK-1) TaxID=709032 RepID=E4U3P2_SULKY|nr:hypothetical protein Sulku_2658 [Sulfuricurvum kujiense DSM 16994]
MTTVIHSIKSVNYLQFLDSLESIEKRIGQTSFIESKIELIQIQLDIFEDIDKMSYQEATDLLNKVKILNNNIR